MNEIFHMQDILGQGSFSVVYRVRGTIDGGACESASGAYPPVEEIDMALKMIWKDDLNEEIMGLLESEVSILKGIKHDHIVSLFGVYETENEFGLLQELLDGRELFDEICARGAIEENEAALILQQVTTAVEHLHSIQIVHRDIKPENIILTATESGHVVAKLTDFGIATEWSGEIITMKCGSPQYMAPEILIGNGYGPEVDMWAIGVVLHVMLCGSLPFYQPPPLLYDDIKLGRYNMNQDAWQNVSLEAVELVAHLIQVDLSLRLGPSGILSHRWITFHLECGSQPTTPTSASLKKDESNSPPSPCSLKQATEAIQVASTQLDDSNLMTKVFSGATVRPTASSSCGVARLSAQSVSQNLDLKK